MKTSFITGLCKNAVLTFSCLLVSLSCSDDQLMMETTEQLSISQLNITDADATMLADCSACDYVVPAGQPIVDGAILGIKPGSIIGLSANFAYLNITFRNIIGTAEQPIIIKNCDGTALVDGTGTGFSIKTSNSKFFRITGGNNDQSYGIVIKGGQMSVNLGGLSTNFEVDHLEIANSGFAGIMAKTDPSCNDATIRENFLMEDVRLHHNYIHDTGGEGIYAGNSWYSGMNTACGTRLPHEIHNISIDNNIVRNTGWDGIQLGCATIGASIHNNTIENFGVIDKNTQNNGIQLSAGTGGLCHSNLIRKGTGHGLTVMGLGDNIVFNNIIDQAGEFGIFCDERESPGPGFVFLNNTILNPGSDGIRIYADLVPMNVIINNIIANPGSYSTYVYPRSSEDAFIYKLSNNVKIDVSNNYFTTNTDTLEIRNLAAFNYEMDNTSPVIDRGADITPYHEILTDFYGKSRLSGAGYDIGAIETTAVYETPSVNVPPVADAGPNRILTSPVNSTTLNGSGTDSDGSIKSYQWTQYGGLPAILVNATSAIASVSGLTAGKYYFRLTVTDDDGATHYDNMLVRVEAGREISNAAPTANAGPNQIITLPLNAVTLAGSAVDTDGSVIEYRWTQYGGPAAIIENADTDKATVRGLSAGKYYFRLTVKDDDGATGYDNVLVRVEGADASEI